MATLLSDLLQDSDGVLLQDHVGGITWHKAGSGDYTFASNKLVKGAGTGFYRATEDPGTRLVRVIGSVHVLESAFESAVGGVSACHSDVDGTAGYYFGIRSDGPIGSVRLFGWDDVGADLFPEESADYDVAIEDTDIELTLEITETEVKGYVNDELKITVTDASLAGTLVGLIGGWEDPGAEGMRMLGPFSVEDSVVTVDPEAEFTFLVNHRAKTVSFKDLSTDSDGSIVSWEWNLGDGNTSTEQHPIHDYEEEGDYYVTLKVTDDQGNTGEIQHIVAILGCTGEGVTPTYTTQTD